MKSFKDSTKMRSGFKFPESAGFTSSSGKVQQVRGYTRAVVKKATGGQVKGMKQEAGGISSYNTSKAKTIGDQGNSAELRTKPITEFDKDHGGRGPLRPGFAMGGNVRNMMGGALQKAQGQPVPRAGGRMGNMMAAAIQKAQGQPAPGAGGRMGNLMAMAIQKAQANRAVPAPTGGVRGALRDAVGAVQKAATGPQMRTAIPRAGMARRPIMRAKGGKAK